MGKGWTLGLVLLMVAVAACSGSAQTPTTAQPQAATITIENFDFGEPLTVKVGQEVTIVNRDGVPHTWTSTDGRFDSGSLGPGDSFTFTFDQPGEYAFYCKIHPYMEGKIVVEG